MADLTCPGYNRDVVSGTAWDFASETDPDDTQTRAQTKADAKAMAVAMEKFLQHQCPPPCISVPIVRFGKRGAPLLQTPSEDDFKLSLAYTEWILDVLCIPLPGVPGPADGPAEGDIFHHLPDLTRPPKLKEGDVIDDRWVVLHLCKTTLQDDPRSGFQKIRKVVCEGFCQETGSPCQVLSYPRETFGIKPKWSLVPHSEGGVTVRRNPDEAFSHYQCACLAELP